MTNQQYIIISGGASGIGLEISKMYLQLDTPIIVLDKNKKALERLSKLDAKKICVPYLIDFLMEKQLNALIDWLKQKKYNIGGFIACAGYQESIDILDISIHQWRNLFSVNLESSFLISKEAATLMIDQGTKGSILNITSIHSGIIREIAHYSSAKAALEMLTKEFAYRLAEYNIRVNAIAPGAILTPMLTKDLNTPEALSSAAKQIPLGRLGLPQDVANAALFLMSEQAAYITGTTLIVDGGYSLVI